MFTEVRRFPSTYLSVFYTARPSITNNNDLREKNTRDVHHTYKLTDQGHYFFRL